MPSEKANPSPNNQSHVHIADPDSTFKGAVKVNPSDLADGTYHADASLSFPEDVDVWRVHLNEGDNLTVATDNGDDFNPDTMLTLFDSDGNILAFNDDSGGTFESMINFEAVESGNYFVGVSVFGRFPTGGGEFQNGPEYVGAGGNLGDYGLDILIA